MPELILNGNAYPLLITRRRTARRITLRFDTKKQAVTLTIPVRCSLKAAITFAHSKTTWLELQQEKRQSLEPLQPGMFLSVLGQRVWLAHAPARGTAELVATTGGKDGDGTLLTIYGDRDFFNRRLKDFLKKHLHHYISTQAQLYAGQLGVTYQRITIRDVAHHWGSCSAKGGLSFSSNLVFADSKRVDYIICHEVAHLREMNHSKRFWQLVEELCPEYAHHRQWFKTHGYLLHRF